MKRRFLSVVPKAVQGWAAAMVPIAVLIGLVAGYHAAGRVPQTMFAYAAATLVFGILTATWLLCLGFVFADARQRAMPPLGWTFVAMLMPNLLGFLLYFVMRKPLAVPCASCGRATPLDQPFCCSCGSSRSQVSSGGTPPVSAADPIGI